MSCSWNKSLIRLQITRNARIGEQRVVQATLRGYAANDAIGSLRAGGTRTPRPLGAPRRRFLSYSFKGEKLRVAIVGGGCAGLSTALHLAPLVERGLIAGPIDIFDDASGAASAPRTVGVGLWSTALEPFRQSLRTSHQLVYQSMTQASTWLNQVGYRTLDGTWLMTSQLPGSETELLTRTDDMPALIFLTEKDMMQALLKAVHWEELHGKTIQLHTSSRVTGLYEESSQPWSTNLVLSANSSTATYTQPLQLSERDYHLIIAADGTNSVLRQLYGGYDTMERRLMGTSALPSPIELPTSSTPHVNSNVNAAPMFESDLSVASRGWDKAQHEAAVGVQDRHYTVFRGTSNVSRLDNDVCFQTWGTCHSMRFATVSMQVSAHPGAASAAAAVRETKQVWFITTDNEAIASETDPTQRRELLLKEFATWHDPIRQIVSETPPESIVSERAVAHRHCMGPVLAFNSMVVQLLRGKRPPSSGEGPCIVFIGDAFMTIDPILAQGFTCAMEGAAALKTSLETTGLVSVSPAPASGNDTHESLSVPLTVIRDPPLAFDPMHLRVALKQRQAVRMERLICLLRATELVQALGQPSGSTTLSGWIHTRLVRPWTAYTPNWIKAPVFDAVVRYSLGLGLFPRKRGTYKQ